MIQISKSIKSKISFLNVSHSHPVLSLTGSVNFLLHALSEIFYVYISKYEYEFLFFFFTPMIALCSSSPCCIYLLNRKNFKYIQK